MRSIVAGSTQFLSAIAQDARFAGEHSHIMPGAMNRGRGRKSRDVRRQSVRPGDQDAVGIGIGMNLDPPTALAATEDLSLSKRASQVSETARKPALEPADRTAPLQFLQLDE